MSLQIIPVTSDHNQSFQCTLTIDGENLALQFLIRYNRPAGYWVMTISDPTTAAVLIDSVPLLSGDNNNILEQYAYLGIGSAYVINASGSVDSYPTENNLGSDFILGWDDTPHA